MLFNSSEYMALFFPAVLLLCILLRAFAGPKAAQAVILVASLTFYTWMKPSNLPYLIGSILVNFALAQAIAKAEQPGRKRLMQLALALNIGYLCVFKYVNFFLASLGARFHLRDLEFPLGISFFTLLQIMYIVDIYEQLLPPLNLFDYATFVSFFPYVISGPLARSKRMKHQFGNFGGQPGTRSALIARGVYVFTMGLFKKVLLADAFAKIANPGFAAGVPLSALEVLCCSVAYTLQIYFDFSGYSDMAIGSALMLGIEIPRNFDAPLRSKSVIEFWTRWHISLSQFITTYLYTPIVKSLWRISLFTSALATFIAMTIAGLWHGPAWTFVAYGVLFGMALAINQYWRKKKMPVLPALLSWLVTFVVVDVALLFFRSVSLPAALHMLAALFHPHNALTVALLKPAVDEMSMVSKAMIPLGLVIAFFGKSSDELSREFKPTLFNALATGAVFVASCLFLAFNTSQSFLYFQF